ncbi:MAG: NMD3-related protein [Candidatus Aenigmatarchaeota archaeon]
MIRIKEKFCPKCGKETEEMYEGLCEECFREGFEWKFPEKIEITACKFCGKIKEGGQWRDIPLKEGVKKRVEDELNPGGRVEDMEVLPEEGEGRFDVSEEVEGLNLEGEAEIEVKVKEGICKDCREIRRGGYEAVLQIRGDKEKTEEALDLCEKKLEERKRSEGAVTDIRERENGVDLFMASNSTAKNLARKLMTNFDADRKDSKTLRGLREGEKIYRSTYLVRIRNGAE